MATIRDYSHGAFLVTTLTATKHVHGDLLPPIVLSTLPANRLRSAGQAR